MLSLRNLTEELLKEASTITTKSLPPVGLDYRGRTKLERLLFLITKKYCLKYLYYEIAGMSYTHQHCFYEAATENSWDVGKIEIVKEGFRLCALISDIASSNPYIVESSMNELGGTVDNLLVSLKYQICEFVTNIEK